MIIYENDTAQRARVEECRPSRVHYAAASVASVASVAASVAASVVGVPRAAALGAAATVLSQLLHAVCDASPGMYEPCIA